MKWLAIGFIFTALWIAFEIWRAPLVEEKEDGRIVTKRPAKKLLDLLKKK